MHLEEKISLKVKNRVNEQIRSRELRVISDSGEQLGIVPLEEAMEMARDRGLDLVEISDKSNPPVAKIIDFGKFRYEKEKSYKENKKKQKVVVVKEVKIRPQIDQHDLLIKKKRVQDFISEDKKVKVLKAFDKASTVKEAKVIFETLNEGLVSKSATTARPQGSASRATGTITEAKKPIIESNEVYHRMRQLAGLI